MDSSRPATADINAYHERGREMLARPVLPLLRMALFFHRTGNMPMEEVIDQFPDDVENGPIHYHNAAALLRQHSDFLNTSCTSQRPPAIVAENGAPLGTTAALEAHILHTILSRELEEINSLLCYGRGCDLCCTGPDAAMRQDFFYLPLTTDETAPFQPITTVDSPAGRNACPEDDHPLVVNGRPFHDHDEPLLVHWKSGWHLVLPRKTRCPALHDAGCTIYPQRPQVCRKPQIFPYVLEKAEQDGTPVLRRRDAILAVTDCPYVRELKDAISAYGTACGLSVYFRANKE